MKGKGQARRCKPLPKESVAPHAMLLSRNDNIAYCTVQYSKVQYRTVQYITVRYSTVQHAMLLSRTENIAPMAATLLGSELRLEPVSLLILLLVSVSTRRIPTPMKSGRKHLRCPQVPCR